MANRATPATQQEGLSPPWSLATFDANWNSPITAHNDASLGFANYIATDTGSANNYIVSTVVGVPSAYNQGMRVTFTPANNNTGASTVNVNSLGTQSIRNSFGTVVTPGDIIAGQALEMEYDGINFRILSPCASNVMSANIYNTNRVLFDDFLWTGSGVFVGNQYPSALPWFVNITGTGNVQGSQVGVDATNLAQGVAALSISGGGGAQCTIDTGPLWAGLGPLEIDMRVAVGSLPTGASNFNILFGIAKATFSFTDNAILISGTFSGASAQFFGRCVSASTTTSTTGLAWTSNNMIRLKILINSTWTSVTFFAGGTQIGSAITTNIPTGQVLIPAISILNLSGAGVQNMYVDTFYANYQYNSP